MEDIDFNIDYYKVLEIDKNSSNKIIKKAYYKLAKETHPDVSGSHDDAKFKKIGNAYSVLGDENKRKIYDNMRRRQSSVSSSFGDGMFQNIFGSSFSPNDGMFSNMFASSAFSNMQHKRKPKPIRTIINVTLEDIYMCRTKTIKINKRTSCAKCGGSKIDRDKYSKSDKNYSCCKCLGRGVITMVQTSYHTRISIPMVCPQCRGARILVRPEIECGDCRGSGKRNIVERITCNISHDIKHGSIITLPNRGDQPQAGDEPGDINLIVNQTNHPIFRRSKNGNDLLMIEKISLYFSLGCGQQKGERTITVHTISNKILKITIANDVIIKPGNVIKIYNEGIQGHLYIVFEVIFPDAISEEERSLLRDMLAPVENDNETFEKSQQKREGRGIGEETLPDEVNKEECIKFDRVLEYSDLEPIKISEIYSSFPINKKIRANKFKDDESSEDFTSNDCPIM